MAIYILWDCEAANTAYKLWKYARGLQTCCHVGMLWNIFTDSVHVQTKERHHQDGLGRVLC